MLSLRNRVLQQCTNTAQQKHKHIINNHILPTVIYRYGNNYNTTIQYLQQRYSIHSMMQNQLLNLCKMQADQYPYDAAKQFPYYQELIKANNINEAMQRYESGRYASNSDISRLLQPYIHQHIQHNNNYAQQQQQQYNTYQQPNAYNTVPQYQFTQPSSYDAAQQQQQQQQSNYFTTSQPQYNTQTIPPPPQSSYQSIPGSLNNPIYVATTDSHTSLWQEIKRSVVRFLFTGALIIVTVSVLVTIASKQLGGSLSGNSMFPERKAESQTPNVRFDDVKGCDEAKADLEELVAYLKNPEQFNRLGGKMPKGILMLGPPGTGKTLLAKAVAGEANVPFFACSGSEFEEIFVGVGARRIRELFAAARKRAPAIIFIDEIDALGGRRHARDHSASRQSLNEILTQMDGFNDNSGIIVIGATNTPKMLDPALTRPGRFDRHVTVSLPDMLGRKAIIELYAGKVPMAPDVKLDVLAKGTPGWSGADLFNMINTAAVRASANGQAHVTMHDLEYAKDKVLMGPERTNVGKTPESVRNTAYHETGHALVAIYTPGAMPVHKATILPRGQTLGMTLQLPDNDIESQSKRELLARIDVCMGGRVAEELLSGLDNVSTGASNDLEQATYIARSMVMRYGMGDSAGLMAIDNYDTLSTETKKAIDDEVKTLLDNSYKRAKNLLTSNRHVLDTVSAELMKNETLSGEEIKQIIQGNKLQTKPLSHNIKTNTDGAPLPQRLE